MRIGLLFAMMFCASCTTSTLRTLASQKNPAVELSVLSLTKTPGYSTPIPVAIEYFPDGIALNFAIGSHGLSYKNNFIGEIYDEECKVKKMFFRSKTQEAEHLVYIEDKTSMIKEVESANNGDEFSCMETYKNNKTIVIVTESERGFTNKSQTVILIEK